MASRTQNSSLLVVVLMAVFCAAGLLPSLVAGSRSLKKTPTEHFIVVGRVFCDTCKIGYATPASTYIAGALVKVVCKDRSSGYLTYTAEGVTDKTGKYRIKVENDHANDNCEAVLVSGPDKACAKLIPDRASAPVFLTFNNGVDNPFYERFANNIGYEIDTALSACEPLLKLYKMEEDLDV